MDSSSNRRYNILFSKALGNVWTQSSRMETMCGIRSAQPYPIICHTGRNGVCLSLYFTSAEATLSLPSLYKRALNTFPLKGTGAV